MNAFDGVLTMLGVIIGAHISGLEPGLEPIVIIAAGMSCSMAMGISGFSGAYMTERAERNRELRLLEKSMLKKMDNTIHQEASDFASVFIAIVDGVSPAIAAMCVISPYFAANLGLVSLSTAFYSSIAATLAILFVLGLYLAKVSEENILRYGIKMLIIGGFTAFMCALVTILIGSTV
jgi:predicted membrane protein (TIGR00267 family)